MAEAVAPAEHGTAQDGTGCAVETGCAAGKAWPREAPLGAAGGILERNGVLVQECDVQHIPAGPHGIPLIDVRA